ncbi:MAG: hypothetical protein H6609_20075 [Ignavibacteriales bacterium]|nr:hypothetical protein [Ignavibacteriales bacterium]
MHSKEKPTNNPNSINSQAPPPAVYIHGPNNGIGLILRAVLDDNNQEFGTIDFAPCKMVQ